MTKKVTTFAAMIALLGAGLVLSGCLPEKEEEAPTPVAEEEVLIELDAESLTKDEGETMILEEEAVAPEEMGAEMTEPEGEVMMGGTPPETMTEEATGEDMIQEEAGEPIEGETTQEMPGEDM